MLPPRLSRADLLNLTGLARTPERWKLLRYDVEHQETPEGCLAIIAFLKEFL